MEYYLQYVPYTKLSNFHPLSNKKPKSENRGLTVAQCLMKIQVQMLCEKLKASILRDLLSFHRTTEEKPITISRFRGTIICPLSKSNVLSCVPTFCQGSIVI